MDKYTFCFILCISFYFFFLFLLFLSLKYFLLHLVYQKNIKYSHHKTLGLFGGIGHINADCAVLCIKWKFTIWSACKKIIVLTADLSIYVHVETEPEHPLYSACEVC